MSDVERTYVATVLAMPELVDSHRVAPEDLADEGLRKLLVGVMAARSKGRVSDATVSVEAQRAGLVESVQAIADLAEVVIEPDLEPIADRIRELAVSRRALVEVGRLRAAYERGDTAAAGAVLARMSVTRSSRDDGRVLSFKELLTHTLTEVQAAADESVSGKLIRIGTPTVDAAYRLAPGSMICVGAQTNVGKTSLVWAWLMSLGGRGIPCGMVSVEDREEDLGAKALGEIGGVNPARLWHGASADDWARVKAAILRDHALPISTAWVASRELDGVLARMEFMARVHGAKVVVVDYLQAIAHRPGKEYRHQVNATLAELIAHAGRLGVGLVLCSQLSRPERGNPFREPQLIDLKESGDIENRAQCVVLLWRKSDQPGPTLAKIAKAKRQPAGRRFTLGRHPQHAGLVELDSLPEGQGHEDSDGPTAYRRSFGGSR